MWGSEEKEWKGVSSEKVWGGGKVIEGLHLQAITQIWTNCYLK